MFLFSCAHIFGAAAADDDATVFWSLQVLQLLQ
jgi:hypothetical protein